MSNPSPGALRGGGRDKPCHPLYSVGKGMGRVQPADARYKTQNEAGGGGGRLIGRRRRSPAGRQAAKGRAHAVDGGRKRREKMARQSDDQALGFFSWIVDNLHILVHILDFFTGRRKGVVGGKVGRRHRARDENVRMR